MVVMRKSFLFLLSICASGTLFGQVDTIYNTKALERIPYYEQLYKFRVWRDINFSEKQNSVFKSPNSNIANFLVENIKLGKLKTYDPSDFSFSKEISAELAIGRGDKATYPTFSPNKDYGGGDQVIYGDKTYTATRSMVYVRPPSDATFWRQDRGVKKLPAGLVGFDETKSYSLGDAVAYNGGQYKAIDDMTGVRVPTNKDYWNEGDPVQGFFSESDVSMIQIVEDVIFDKRRSRLYYDIIGFILLDPTTGNPNALISYKEFYNLVDKVSHDREMRVRNTVKWKNRYNPAQDMNFSDAFKLRLFHGIIKKVENPDDQDVSETYLKNGRTYGESVFARWEEEMKMMEKEHNLWEY